MRDEQPTRTTDMLPLPRRIRWALQWARHGALTTRAYSSQAATLAHRRQEGQTLVLFTIFFTVILGMAALVLDIGLLRKTNLDLHNALDSGALAGIAMLPNDAVGAEKVAREYVQLNFPGGLPEDNISVSFRCLIGVKDGAPRLTDVPLSCNPGSGVNWTIEEGGSTAFARCVPAEGDVCNVIVLKGPAEREYALAPALGVAKGSTATHTAAACKGLCGEPPEVPVDLVMIVDRTNSMSDADRQNAENAAQTVRTSLDPRVQWLSFGLLHKSKNVNGCVTIADNVNGWTAEPTSATDRRSWIPIGLTGTGAGFDQDYTAITSKSARAIDCFDKSSGQGTDLVDPVRMATYELQNFGRSGAVKAILLMSDGQPNKSKSGRTDYCREAVQAATTAKAAGLEVYTVGFGVDDVACQDPFGTPWYQGKTTHMLAAMATASKHEACNDAENNDGDHYFCLPRSGDLSDVFKKAVEQLSSHSRLIKVPEDA